MMPKSNGPLKNSGKIVMTSNAITYSTRADLPAGPLRFVADPGQSFSDTPARMGSASLHSRYRPSVPPTHQNRAHRLLFRDTPRPPRRRGSLSAETYRTSPPPEDSAGLL